MSQLAFACPIFFTASYIMPNADVNIDEKNISQLINFWTVILAFQGCKKTSMHKFIIKNIGKMNGNYNRDHKECNLEEES